MQIFTTKTLIVGFAVIILLAVAVAFANLGTTSKPDASAQTVSTGSAAGAASPSPGASTKTGAAAALTPAHASSSPKTACGVLTAQIAGQILGGGATQGSATVPASQTKDVATTACAYTAAAGQLQLVAHLARTSLGQSENDLVFGSERPAGVTPVTGVGQSAFWDPASGQENVLASSNWYIITWNKQNKTVPTQQVQQAAEVVARNF